MIWSLLLVNDDLMKKINIQINRYVFFSACNENPYYILGKTYMKKYNYKRAEQILYMGYQTYPYATELLEKDLVVCLRLLGKHQKADLIEAQKE